ncbi:T9SS type A sorting domain-containing protein [Lacinutrix mariniflava]|uniref:T9SS type A sorting domain-containing protein n=1 Tax=Lacinutrix mariniflava TaxID=342955 RepID=UPI0006E21CD1|nr:T9SS type A sorting domain-containing protein [Lacinutrix mariniflava]
MKLKITLLCLAISAILNGQTTDVITTGLNNVQDLYFVGNELYIANYPGGILKANISVSNPTPTVVANHMNILTVLENSNILYAAGNGPGVENFTLGGASNGGFSVTSNVSSIVINNNDMFIALKDQMKIVKKDLTNTSQVVDYLNVTRPNDLCLVGSTLYIAEGDSETVSKIDISSDNPTLTNVITNIGQPTQAIEVLNNYLYVAVSYPSIIYRVDLLSSNPTLEQIATMSNEIGALRANGNDLYIGNSNVIKKLDLNTLSTRDNNVLEASINLYPNPVTNTLKIETDKTIISLQLNDINGKTIYKTNQALTQLDMSTYNSGLYFMKIETEAGVSVKKVVKE